MTMHIAPTAHAVDKRDHSAVPCFLCKQTQADLRGERRPWHEPVREMPVARRKHLRHNELDDDELAPQAVEWTEGILAGAGA